LPQAPVVIKEALYRCQGDQRKTVQEEDFVVSPAVDRRKEPEQDPEADKSRDIGTDHADCRDDEIGTVAHLALEVLCKNLQVNT